MTATESHNVNINVGFSELLNLTVLVLWLCGVLDWPFWLLLVCLSAPLVMDLCLWGWDAYRAREERRRFSALHYPGLVR